MSASPRRCSRPRSPRASPPAAGCGSAPPGSPPTRRLEEFDFTFQRSVKKQVIEHLGQLDFLHAKQNVILFGPARDRQDTHLDRAGGPCVPRRPAGAVPHRDRMGRAAGRRATPRQARRGARPSRADPVAGLRRGRLHPVRPPSREPDVHARLPPLRTRILIVTSNKPFSAWGEIFGDDMAATAMVDRLIHHAEILSLKGDSYRLKDRDLGPRPGRHTAETA